MMVMRMECWLVGVMMVGFDTSRHALCFCFYELAKQISVQKKLREEIYATIGKNKNPTYDQLMKMKYLDCVLLEGLRLYADADW